MAFHMIYGQKRLTDDLIKVVDVFRTVLPPKEVRSLSVPMRDGAYYAGQNYGARVIEVDILLHASSPEDYHDRQRLLAYFLDSEGPQPLWFSDEPELMYFAVLIENTNLDEILYIGKGTLRFLCPNPYAYTCDVTLLSDDGDNQDVYEVLPREKVFLPDVSTGTDKRFEIENFGTAPTYPVFTTRFVNDSSHLAIISPMGVIMVGQPRETVTSTYKSIEKILADNMGSMDGWVSAGTLTGIANTGSMTALVDTAGTGYMKASSYGEGEGWHGPAVRKNIPNNRTAEQFRFKMDFTMSSNRDPGGAQEHQLGLLQVIGWAADGKRIFTFQFSDASKYYEASKVQIRLGDRTVYHPDLKMPTQKYKQVKSGEKEINEKYYDKKTKTWKTRKKKVPVYKSVPIASGSAGIWTDFWGQFSLERRKKTNKKGATFYEYRPRLSRYYQEGGKTKSKWAGPGMGYYNDVNSNGGWSYAGSSPLAYVTIQICAHGVSPAMGQMQVAELHIEELFPERENETPIIFEAGDEVEVNLEDNVVTRNGQPMMEHVDIGSSFFPLEPGTVEVVMTSDDAAALHEASLTERFL